MRVGDIARRQAAGAVQQAPVLDQQQMRAASR